jgi:hypothetical protein
MEALERPARGNGDGVNAQRGVVKCDNRLE